MVEEYEFEPKSENVFYGKGVEIQLTFNIDKDGQVVSLILLAGGQETTCPKLEK